MKRNKLLTIKKLCSNDLINKFCLKSIFFTPRLEQIEIKLNIEHFLSQIDLDPLEKKENSFKFKLFYTFYFIFFSDPLLKLKTLSRNTNKNILSFDNIFIKSLLIKRNQVFNFLNLLFVESSFNSEMEDLKEESKMFLDKYRLNFKIRNLPDFDYFFSSNLYSVDLKESQLPITFVFKKYKQKTMIKNLFPFWIY